MTQQAELSRLIEGRADDERVEVPVALLRSLMGRE